MDDEIPVPVIQFDVVKMELEPRTRKLKDGCRFYGSSELLKNKLAFEKDDVPYNDTFRNPDCLTKQSDLKLGDVVFNDWYDGSIREGFVINLHGDSGVIKYSEDLQGFIEFSKDDRECWCQHSWSMCNGIDLNAELVSIVQEEIYGKMGSTIANEMAKEIDQEIIRTIQTLCQTNSP